MRLILYWHLYWGLANVLLAGCLLLAACCFCFCFCFFFLFLSFHLISSHFISFPISSHVPSFPKTVGPLYLLPPLLITSGSEPTLFTTPLLIATPRSGTTESCNDTAVEPSHIIACSSLFLGLWPFHRAESLLNFM